MTKTKRFSIDFILLSLLVGGYLYCREASDDRTPIDLSTVAPAQLSYQKHQFEVQRQWLKLSSDASSTPVVAFLYYPVTATTQQQQQVLPGTAWQQAHFASIQRKLGSGLAAKMVQAKLPLAETGTLPARSLPLLVFGPGLGWLPTDYSSLLASLASKGYLVLAISAVPISRQLYFPDGSMTETPAVQADYQAMASYFNLAISAVLQQKQQAETLFSQLDEQRIFVAGHSVSGAAALIAAQHNSQIKGVINLDGDVNDSFSDIQPAQPVLYITTQPPGSGNNPLDWSDDRSEKRRDGFFSNTSKNSRLAIRIKIPSMYHLDFVDAAAFKSELPDLTNSRSFGSIDFHQSSELVSKAMSVLIEGQQSWLALASQYSVLVETQPATNN